MWDRRAVVHHAQLAEGITTYSPIAQNAIMQLVHGDAPFGASVINGMITLQAYQISFNELFYALGWIFFALISVVWLAKPPSPPKSAPLPRVTDNALGPGARARAVTN
jgi:MFS transporter, DHA2 family, multidrug resistance protein